VNTIATDRFKPYNEPMELEKSKPSNFLIENRKKISNLYFEAVGEKEILKSYLEQDKYPSDKFLIEYSKLDELCRSLARFIMP
jgi:hypothetical protein